MQIEDYNLEHGTDIFIEYKDPNTTEERKKEIVDFLFNLTRTNGIPMVQLNEYQIQDKLIELSEVTVDDVYSVIDGVGTYGFNTSCVNVLRQFFPEMNFVEKEGKPSVDRMYHNDYRYRRAVEKALKYSDSDINIVNWIIMIGSGYCYNFRPATAKTIYELWGKEGCKILDSSAGYGARMLGAHMAHNHPQEYLGIDPNTAESCNKLAEFLDTNFPTGVKKQVLKMGSEDFTKENFPQYQEYFDISFSSPPYFDCERYSSDETQSYKKFPKYDLWIKGFYRQTIYNACDALKKDGVFAINIFEKIGAIRDITKLFLADKGWYFVKEEKYLLRTIPGSNHKFDEEGNPIIRDMTVGKNFEPIWIAKHYTQLYKEGLIDEKTCKEYEKRVKC